MSCAVASWKSLPLKSNRRSRCTTTTDDGWLGSRRLRRRKLAEHVVCPITDILEERASVVLQAGILEVVAHLQLVRAHERAISASKNKVARASSGRTPPAEKTPAEILKEFSDILATEPTDLGVDPEDLELAWEMCAETEVSKGFTPKSIVSIVDETYCKSSVDLYKAFRLVSSDLGKVFFKSLGENKFKAKASKAVKASKDNWCRSITAEPEFCFV